MVYNNECDCVSKIISNIKRLEKGKKESKSMFSFLSSIIQFFMYWVFMYVGAFLLMIVGIFYVIKSHPTPPTPIIHEHKIVQNIIQPPKRVLVEREVCKDVRGCELLKGGECPDCVMDFVWEWV